MVCLYSPNVTYLKVELNDFTQVFIQPQGVYELRSVETMAMLAHVDIEGDGLLIGVPQPLEISTGSSSSSSKDSGESSKSSSSKSSSSSKASSSPAKSSTAAVDLSPSSTSTKFEGIVYPESATEKTSSLVASSKFQGAVSPSKTSALEVTAEEELSLSNEYSESASETFFFPANDSGAKKSSSVFIVSYVIVLTAGIFFALKNRTGSGK